MEWQDFWDLRDQDKEKPSRTSASGRVFSEIENRKTTLVRMLTFGKLESLARTGLTGFFALFLARVAFEMTGSLEWNSRLGIVLFQSPGEAVADGASLTIGSTTGYTDDSVELIRRLNRIQRRDSGFG